MKTKIISLDSFDFYVSLNYFGSNLGLLPGMGLFQMIEGMEILTLSISRRGVGTPIVFERVQLEGLKL